MEGFGRKGKEGRLGETQSKKIWIKAILGILGSSVFLRTAPLYSLTGYPPWDSYLLYILPVLQQSCI